MTTLALLAYCSTCKTLKSTDDFYYESCGKRLSGCKLCRRKASKRRFNASRRKRTVPFAQPSYRTKEIHETL